MRERELVAAIAAIAARLDRGVATGGRTNTGAHVLLGPGDDCAVVRAGSGVLAVSVDQAVEGVHFRSDLLTPHQVGHRCLAAALSDLAAMGAAPGEAYLALGIPDGASRRALGVVEGALTLAASTGVTLAGGDVTGAPALVVSFTVCGRAADAGDLVSRSGARPGDVVAVTGAIGGAGAGLALLDGTASAAARTLPENVASVLAARYALPQPRIEAGLALARGGAHAMIDLSDGLASDIAHLAIRSSARIRLDATALPLEAGVSEVATAVGADPRMLAASWGDDYELCVCLPAATARALRTTAKLTVVGEVLRGEPGVEWTGIDGDPPAGFEHVL